MKSSYVFILLLSGIWANLSAAAPGDIDNSFAPAPAGTGSPGTHAAAIQPDGKLVIGGSFLTMGGTSHGYIARITSSGAVDNAFTPATNDVVQACVLQDDGKIILTGQFTTVGGSFRTHIVRLLPDGGVDPSFSTYAEPEVRVAVPLADGKIIFGGFFTSINGMSQRYLARTNSDGSLDATFAPVLNARLRMVLRQPDGKLLIGGDFSRVNSVARNRLARLNANGSLDTTFNASITGSGVYCAALQPDGKIVIAGSFTSVGGIARINVARIHSDGSPDTAFNTSSNDTVRGMCLQTDGKITFLGQFTQFGGVTRNRIARVMPGGELDTTFTPTSDALIFGATLQADGKLIVQGQFGSFNGFARSALVRLQNDAAFQSLTVPTPGRIQWNRSGSSPETSNVDFQLSTDGGTTWTNLGMGSRISGGWERSGILLPVSGLVRARARIHGGYGNCSLSILQTPTAFSFSPQLVWRQEYFGSPSNTGNAADNADPDRDGLENLIEFAFGGNPLSPDQSVLPEWETGLGSRVLEFSQPPGVAGVNYRVERSENLSIGSWTPLPNLATPPDYFFFLPELDSQRTFLRVLVQAP